MKQVNNQESEKSSFFLKSLLYFLSILFPFVKMISLNRKLSLAEQTLSHFIEKDKKGNYRPPYDWFPRQKKRNLIFGFLSVAPLVFSLIMSYSILSTNQIFIKGYNAAKKEAVKFRIFEAKKKFEIANKIDPSVYKDIKIASNLIIIGLSISLIIGFVIVYFHPILTETKVLKKYLLQSGYIKEEDNPEILATPVGFLIDIVGNTPREIADSDRIWIPLNIRVNKDWAENPNKRSLVFFKKAYELKKGDEYGFNKIPKN